MLRGARDYMLGRVRRSIRTFAESQIRRPGTGLVRWQLGRRGRWVVQRPGGPCGEAGVEVLGDLVGGELGALVGDGVAEGDDAAAACGEAAPGGGGDGCVLDPDGDDGGAGAADDEADAWAEGEECAWWAFDAAFGEEAEDAAGFEVCDGFAEAVAAAGLPIDEDDLGEVPCPFEGWGAHVFGHDEADEAARGGLEEDGVEACGVVGDEDGVAEGFGGQCASDFEAVDEDGVELCGAPGEAGLDVAARVVEDPA